MIHQLPIEINEIIYRKLPVHDRVKFWMALPREARVSIKRKSPITEKKLGVLSKAIEKKKIFKLSTQMISFIKEQCDRDDPTIKNIFDEFSIKHNDIFQKEVFGKYAYIKKALDGTLTHQDLEDFKKCDDDQEEYDVSTVIYRCKPSSFVLLFQDDYFRPSITRYSGESFLFNLFNYANKDLLEFIRNGDGKDLFAWNWDAVKKTATGSCTLMYIIECRKLILEYLTFTNDELQKLWENAMETMNIDVAIDIDNKIKQQTIVLL